MRNCLFLVLITLWLTPVFGQNVFETDRFETEKGPLIITFYGHGTLGIAWNNQIIQVDPWSKLVDYSSQPKADIILVTHEHGDHLDTMAISKLRKKSTILVCNQRVKEVLGDGLAMQNGEFKNIGDIRIEAVPAYNITPDHQKFHPKGRDNGFVLTMGGKRVYIAGDTEDIPEMEELKNIDIAFLPVNQPYTMTPEQFAHAASMIRPRVLYPYHTGQTDMEKVKQVIDPNLKIDLRLRKMQ